MTRNRVAKDQEAARKTPPCHVMPLLLFVFLFWFGSVAYGQEVAAFDDNAPQLSIAPREWQGVIVVPEYPLPQRETARFPILPERVQGSPMQTPTQTPIAVYEIPPDIFQPPRLKRPPGTLRMTAEDIAPWLQKVARDYPQSTQLRRLAQTAGGRFVWALEIRPQNVAPEYFRRIAIICRQHGDEPETSAAGVELIYQLLKSPSARTQSVLGRVALLIIPVANPDGAFAKRRTNALKQDLNRDWGRGRTREVSAIMYELQRWQPNLVVDVHQWVPGDRTQTPMAEVTGGLLGHQAGAVMAQAARQKGYALSYRSHGGGGTLCHHHYGRNRGVPAILLETVHRPNSAKRRQIAIQTSVIALQRAIDLLAQ